MVKFGEVYWLDLTSHTLPSSTTMKSRHPVVVVQDERRFSPSYPNVILVPGTSFRPGKHWDASSGRLKYAFHHLLHCKQYGALTQDTVIKCEQILTISSDYLQSKILDLRDSDMKEILRRIALAVGFGRV